MASTLGRAFAAMRIPISIAFGGTGRTTEFRKGFIDGFKLVFVGRQALTVTAGAAYVNSLGRIVELTSDKVMTGLTLTAQTVHHVYLFENGGVGDIEISTAVPVNYYGTAYYKTGDSSRRYLGSFLVTLANTMARFTHDAKANRMFFSEGQPGVLPYTLWSNYSSATPTLITSQLVPVFPLQTMLSAWILTNGTGQGVFSPSDQQTAPGGANWGTQTNTGGGFAEVFVGRTGAQIGQFYAWVQSGTQTAFAVGYTFER